MPVVISLGEASVETVQSVVDVLKEGTKNIKKHFESGVYIRNTNLPDDSDEREYSATHLDFALAAEENHYAGCALGLLYVANAKVAVGPGNDVKWHARCLLDQVATELFPYTDVEKPVTITLHDYEAENGNFMSSSTLRSVHMEQNSRNTGYENTASWGQWGIEAVAEDNAYLERERQANVLLVYKEARRRAKTILDLKRAQETNLVF